MERKGRDFSREKCGLSDYYVERSIEDRTPALRDFLEKTTESIMKKICPFLLLSSFLFFFRAIVVIKPRTIPRGRSGLNEW